MSIVRPLVLVNNSEESFTPTHSGAIATFLWELCRASLLQGDAPPLLVTRGAGVPSYPWPDTITLPRRRRVPGPAGRVLRRVGRAAGWSKAGQWRYARAVAKRLAPLRPAAVVCHNDPEVALYLERRLPDARVVHWFHNLEVPADRARRGYRERRQAVASVAVSRYLARAVERAYVLEPGSVTAVHNGVDLERFTAGPVTGGEHAAVPERPVIGFIGRTGYEKGADVLLEACLLLAGRVGPVFGVQVVGANHWGPATADPYQDRLGALVAALADTGVTVSMPGHVVREEVPATLRRSAVHVVPSRWDEPFGLTVLEGMACGIPTVVSACGGTPEIAGTAAVLVERESPVALATALERLVLDADARMAAGIAARARAEGFSWSVTWAALVQVTEVAGTVSSAVDRAGPGPLRRPW